MASYLTQSDMDTLYTAASETTGSPAGPYNEIGTSTGEFTVGRLTSDFEKNAACVIAIIEFILANTNDPSASTADRTLCRQQRKALKDLLAKASQHIAVAPNAASDTRAAVADAMLGKLITFHNLANRPDVIE